MRKIEKTDPFTGLKIEPLQMTNDDLIVETPFNGTVTLEYVLENDTYTIPATLFKFRETMTLKQASEYLDVSRMKISRLCSHGTLKSVKVNGSLVIDSKSVEQFKESELKNVRTD